MLGASQAALLGAASAAVTYDTLVGIFNPDLVSYWKFESDGVDEKGTQNASFVGTPELNVETIVDLDTIAEGAAADGKCIAWPGTPGVHAEASHNAAHKTPEGTIVVTFQHDSLAQKSILLAADANAAAGGLSLEVQSDGSPRSFLRRHSNGSAVIMVGQAGDVQLNEAYTMVFKWGQGGLSMALWNEDGSLVRRVTNALTDGVTGTSPISFGLWHDGVQSPHVGPFGRVIWLKRRISQGEEAILARARTIERSTGEYITTPEAHGWLLGNTDLQNTAALQAAIDNASANAGSSSTGRGVVELVQGKTYTVRVNSNGSSSSNPVNALTAKSNVEIRTAGQPARASGNQATVKWHSWGGFANGSIKHRNLLWISNVSNFHCGYVQFHGNKNTMPSRHTPDYTSGTNGGLNCISMRNSISNIVLKEVDSQHAITDTLLVNCTSATGVLIEDCNFSRSRRNGMSMARCNSTDSGHDQFILRRCAFADSGDFPGDIDGLQPGYGVDVEPDQTSEHNHGVTFDTCTFTGNRGSLFINGDQTTSTLFGHGCAFDCKAQANKVKIINCSGSGNTARNLSLGLREAPTWDNWRVENFVSSGSGINGVNIAASGSGTGGRVTNAVFINCNMPSLEWENGGFPSPWNTGWSVTIWKGNFNPTVTTFGVQTVTVNNGFPP